MEQYEHAGLRFDVSDDGPVDGDVVILLHGYPEDRTSWSAITPKLVAEGYRTLAPDQRGYSPGARPQGRGAYRMTTLASDVIALADAAGARRFHVVGHDWGGAVAWALAALYPDRVATMTSLTTPHPAAMQRAMLTSTQGLKSWYMFFYQLPWLPEQSAVGIGSKAFRRSLIRSGLPGELADKYIDRLREPGAATGAINWYRGLVFRPPPVLSQPVTVPTLYVYATGDFALGRKAADLTGRYVSGPYRYELLDGVSHWVPEAAPDAAASLVLAHLRQHS